MHVELEGGRAELERDFQASGNRLQELVEASQLESDVEMGTSLGRRDVVELVEACQRELDVGMGTSLHQQREVELVEPWACHCSLAVVLVEQIPNRQE